MALCRGVLLLLLFAVFLSCLDTALAASADATTTIQVDGVNVTIDNEVCEVAGWRTSSLYATVTPAAEILFEARYGAPYYQQHLKPKVVPNLVLLIVFILLLLFFVFWRWIYCCCQCCCNCCLPSTDPMKYIRDRGMKATKIFATLMALGVVASGIFGMTQAGKYLVDKTLYTVGLYTGLADDVFEGAYNITTDAQSGLRIFDDLAVILDVDVNVTGMQRDVQCLSPWLGNMVDPTDISTDLGTLQLRLTGTFDPARTSAESGLAAYSTAGTGDWYRLAVSNMQYIAGATAPAPLQRSAPDFFTNYQQAVPVPYSVTAYQNAVAPGALSPATAGSIGGLLDSLFDSTVTHNLGTRSSDLANIQQALSDLSALHTDSLSGGPLQLLVDNLSSLRAEGIQLFYNYLPGLITELSGQYNNYTAVSPCFDSLLYQIEHINETVIGLPPNMEISYNLLAALNQGMKALVTGASTNPQTLAAALAALRPTLPVLTSTNTTITELPKHIAVLRPAITGLADLITDVQKLQTDSLTSTAAYVDTAAAYQAYLVYVATTPSTPSAFATFQSAQQTASNSLNTFIVGDLSQLTTSPDSTALSAAATVAQQVIALQTAQALPPPAPQVALVAAMTTSEAAVPPLPPYIAAEAGQGAAYRALPSPKASVLSSVTNTVSDLDSRFTQTIAMVRAEVSDYSAEVISKIVTLHNSTVDQVDRKIDQYLPRVRKYDHMRMTGEYVYFSLVMFIALMIILIVWVNYQWGASFFTFLMLIAMLIYCIIGTVLLLLAVVGHDECGNAETQIFTLIDHFDVDSGSFNATVLARYYLMGEGGSLNAIAYASTGVDFEAMQSTVNQTIDTTVNSLTSSYTLRYKMLNLVDAIYSLGQLLVADVAAVQELVQFDKVHPLYLSTKELACCDVVDVVGNLWLAMFMAGWFGAALAVAMICYIRRLDELPSKRCCGCAFRSYKEFLEPEDKRLASIKNKGKYMPAGREGSAPGTPGAVSSNTIKVKSNGTLAGGLITGVSGLSATSFDSTQPIKAGIDNFDSDQTGTPRTSQSPRSSAYAAPESARVERSTDSQNKTSQLGVMPLNVEASGGSLLSSGANKQGAAKKSYTSKTEIKKDAMKKAMRMNHLG